MAQWILKGNGNVVPCRTSRPLKPEEIHSPEEAAKRKLFDGLIERRLGTSMNPPIIIKNDDDEDTSSEGDYISSKKRKDEDEDSGSEIEIVKSALNKKIFQAHQKLTY